MYSRTCPGCGQTFETLTYRRIRCRKGCGRSNASRNARRAAASAARRAAYVPTYGAMHQRLHSTRGSARDYPCAHGCGAPAADWAYDHADPDERLVERKVVGEIRTVAYSLDLEHYLPLCRSCHAVFDEGRGWRRSLAQPLPYTARLDQADDDKYGQPSTEHPYQTAPDEQFQFGPQADDTIVPEEDPRRGLRGGPRGRALAPASTKARPRAGRPRQIS